VPIPLKNQINSAAFWVPWWAKIGIKVVISKLPVSRRRWRSIGIFESGPMARLDYAKRVWDKHQRDLVHCRGDALKAVLELGPGEGGYTFGHALAVGYKSVFLVDVEQMFEPEEYLTKEKLGSCGASLSPALARGRVHYLTHGLASLSEIASGSMDLVFSHTVLQHVRLAEFSAFLDELFRITRPGGVGSHLIDFQDMLGGSVNHLRIPMHLWEREWFARSGFYTNRLRHSQMVERFLEAGFEVVRDVTERYQSMPEAAKHRCHEFDALTSDDLMTSGCYLVVRKPMPSP
jgi:SAM-dependent methyltransferase